MSGSVYSVLSYLATPADRAAAALHPIAGATTVSTLSGLLTELPRRPWRAVVLSVVGREDFALIARISSSVPSAVLVAFHPDPCMELALDAETAGAAFFLKSPEEFARLPDLLAPYVGEGADHPVPAGPHDPDRVVGASPALIDAYRTVARVAPSSAPVLIEGESGTGKELVARALHDRSTRRTAPFVTVNCAALPEGLLEAELFGYERGAFTGAIGRSVGRFGRADGGTLFLDEIGEMGPGLQAKLLRALESGEIERLGATEAVRVDVRVVAATNRDLEVRVREGAFREDLFYRLAVVRIGLPSLRDRRQDVRPLAEAFAARFSARYARPVTGFSSKALADLEGRAWPGNVRELRNVLDRAVLLCRGGVIRSVDLSADGGAPSLSAISAVGGDGYPATLSLRDVEERHIRRVLAHTDGHLGDAAAILGVHRNTMTAKVREYGVDPGAPFASEPGSGAR